MIIEGAVTSIEEDLLVQHIPMLRGVSGARRGGLAR